MLTFLLSVIALLLLGVYLRLGDLHDTLRESYGFAQDIGQGIRKDFGDLDTALAALDGTLDIIDGRLRDMGETLDSIDDHLAKDKADSPGN